VVCRERAIVQAFGHVDPTESVLMQHEGRVARNRVQPFLLSRWSIIRRFSDRKIGDITSGPFALGLVPPDQFLTFAPRLAGWAGTCSIIYDAPIAGPGKAPAVAEIVLGLARVPFVHAIAAKAARINPTTARSRSISLKFVVIGDLRTVMRLAFAIDTENDSLVPAGLAAPG